MSIKITILKSNPRKVYKEGDTRMIGKKLYVKTPRLARAPNGRVEGYMARRGKILYEWKPVEEPA